MPCLMLVTVPMDRDSLYAIVREAITGGVNCIQIRDRLEQERPVWGSEEVEAVASTIKTAFPHVTVLVNTDARAAYAAAADGVHLPENGATVASVRAVLAPGSLVGRSIHSVYAAEAAFREGADYLIAGHIYATASHPGEKGAGPGQLREVCDLMDRLSNSDATEPVPIIAIGGIKPWNVSECFQAGASGVAAITGILCADDPRGAASSYLARISSSTRKVAATQ